MAINLNLQDVNDNLPRFQLQNYVAFIWESQSYDSPVIQVSVGAQTGISGPLACLSAGVRGWGGCAMGLGLAPMDRSSLGGLWFAGLHNCTAESPMWLCRSWQMIWIREQMGR